MFKGRTFTVEGATKPQKKVVEWDVVAPMKKRPKVGDMPCGYDEHPLGEDKPETLYGLLQAAYNALHTNDKWLCKVKSMTAGKVSKRPSRERRRLSHASHSHMKSLRQLLLTSQGVRLVGESLFTEMKEVIEQEKVVMPPTHICAIPLSSVSWCRRWMHQQRWRVFLRTPLWPLRLLILPPRFFWAGIIAGKMEDSAAGTVVGLSRLTKKVSHTLESRIEELALKCSTLAGSRVLTDAQMHQRVD